MKFKMGKVVMTRGVNNRIAEDKDYTKFVIDSLNRHENCDWGDILKEDKSENEYSLQKGFRVLSCYTYKKKKKIWIITEAERSATTILFPEEY